MENSTQIKVRRLILMKKRLILCLGLVIAVLLLVCTAAGAAAPLTPQKVNDRITAGGTLSIEEEKAFLESIHPGKTTISLAWADFDISTSNNARRIDLKTAKAALTYKSGTTENKDLPLTESYISIMDDVVLIKADNNNWFSETSTQLSLGSGCTVYPGNNTLGENSRVLILGMDKKLYGYYAASGTAGNNLELGERMNVYRGLQSARIKANENEPNTHADIPWTIIPVFDSWVVHDSEGRLHKNSISTGEGDMTLHIDAEFDMKWYIYPRLTINDFSLEVRLPNIETDIDNPYDVGHETKLLDVSIDWECLIGVTQGLYFNSSGEGKGKTQFSGSAREGFYAKIYYDYTTIVVESAGWKHTDPTFTLVESNLDGECYFGIEWSETLGVLAGVVEIGPAYKNGMVVSGEKSEYHEYPGDPDKNIYWHECEDDECVNGSCFLRTGPFSIEMTLIHYWTHDLLPIWGPKDGEPFVYYFDTKTFGDKGLTYCPHVGYRLNVTAQNQDGEPLKGVNVSYKPVPEHYVDVKTGETAASGKTNAAGKTVLYAKAGKDYYATASITSSVDPSITVTEERFFRKSADVQDMNLTLQIPTKHIWFRNPSTGGTTDWPEDITYMPFYSEQVRLPSNVPQMSGWYFMGWNDKEDGTGKSYLPGQTITAKDDVTLWAKWQKAENSWVIIYEANGASSAPSPQIVPNGVGAYLSRETPDAPTLIFTGWTTDPHNPTPEYQPGDYLAYDSNKRVVILHAVWQISPVRRPIHISYDANGLEGASLPPHFWIIHAGWAQVGWAIAPLGGAHAFLGWSEKPDATKPEYKPGKAYYFDQDTKLYAVWGTRYRVVYGAGSTWTKGSGKTQRFIANGDVKDFVELRVDNLPFNDGVTISSGSTIADISAKAMEKLAVGEHEIMFIYTDGTASANFYVESKYPPTGDANHPALWLILAVSGIAGIALVGKRAFTARRKKQ